jgi:hypothetical protein
MWNHGAVKVRSKRYPVGAEMIHQVLQVVRDHVERRIFVEVSVGPDVTYRQIETDYPVRLADSVKLSVG